MAPAIGLQVDVHWDHWYENASDPESSHDPFDACSVTPSCTSVSGATTVGVAGAPVENGAMIADTAEGALETNADPPFEAETVTRIREPMSAAVRVYVVVLVVTVVVCTVVLQFAPFASQRVNTNVLVRPVALSQDALGELAVSTCPSCVTPLSVGAAVDFGATTADCDDVAVAVAVPAVATTNDLVASADIDGLQHVLLDKPFCTSTASPRLQRWKS